jgi:hypothetical protein
MNSGCEDPLAGTGGNSGTEPALLASVYDPVEAEIIVAKLRSAGIQCYLKHEAAAAVYGLTVDGWGQQDIMVRADELAEARVALETGDADDEAADS